MAIISFIVSTIICIAIDICACEGSSDAGMWVLLFSPEIWLFFYFLIKGIFSHKDDDNVTNSNSIKTKAPVEKIIPHKNCPCCGGQFESTIVYTNSRFFKCEYCDTTFSYTTRATTIIV